MEDSTAFLIDLPENLNDEARQDMIRRINKAISEGGIQARVSQAMIYDSNMGGVVLYQP